MREGVVYMCMPAVFNLRYDALYAAKFFCMPFQEIKAYAILMYKPQKSFQKRQHEPANGITDQKTYFEINSTEKGSCVEWALHETAGSVLLPVGSWCGTDKVDAASSLQPRLCLPVALREKPMEEVLTLLTLEAGNNLYWELLLFWSRAEVKINGKSTPQSPCLPGSPTKITLRMSIHNLPCHQLLCGWGHTTNSLPALMWLLHCQGWCQELVWHPRKEGVELQHSQGIIHLPVGPWQDRLCWFYPPNSAWAIGHLSGQGGRGQVCAMVWQHLCHIWL